MVRRFQCLRTRLANDAKSAKKGGERQFNGLIDVYRKTLASDGMAGLYRGFGISCIGIIVYRGLYFGMYDSLKPVVLVGSLQIDIHWSDSSYPIDTVRRRMMMTLGQAVKYKSSMDAFAQIIKNEGAKSLFKGVDANILASFAAVFGVLALIDIHWSDSSYPIDTVRRRMMMTLGQAVKYKSSMDAFAQIIKNEGAKSLFKGADANILRAVAGAGVLAGYDKLQVIVFGKKYGSGGGG
ncbi:hypothetical protein Nepgr_009093 [Nepenthes gracilis]|uniref:ADP/ATP translocase n=1 Tax=Nepenthes gracilis TaxID=150966 RepID=A0AAD3SA16_NEPGR|nr:hypothetical protein Nepgr_009093 [Nepenthes gracilis]